MILAGQFARQADVERFQTEAESAAKLDHPGIVPILEIGEHDGHHFFSMALVQGQSLAGRIDAGPISSQEAATLTHAITEAVCYAHSNGIIHWDLKPANVLIDQDGQPRVTDFGLAKIIESESDLTATGQILGTPSFMSPEQARGKADQVSDSSDVYSLGAILYAMLTGHPPFVNDRPLDTIQMVINDDPIPPHQFNKAIPRDLEMICLKCLQKRPSDRYASAQDLVDDLGRFLDGAPVHARPLPMLTRLFRWSDRHIGRLTAIAILFTVLLPIPVNIWLAYLFGHWSWELFAVSYGFMLMICAPYILMMLITSVHAKKSRQSGEYLKEKKPVSKGMVVSGGVMVAVAVGDRRGRPFDSRIPNQTVNKT